MGNFPAGAIVVKDGEIISSAVSSPYPGLFHADSKAISAYIGLESCLMCLGVAYWSGIRDIYFAIPKSKVNSSYYETTSDIKHICNEFHEPIKLHHMIELESEALKVVKEWKENLNI